MPKLKKGINGEYYTRTKFNGAFITYQISYQGVDILRAYGYKVGSIFSLEILSKLIHGCYASTGGGGVCRPEKSEIQEFIKSLTPQKKREPDVYHNTYHFGWIMDIFEKKTKILFETNEGYEIKWFLNSCMDNFVTRIKSYKNSIKLAIQFILATTNQQNDAQRILEPSCIKRMDNMINDDAIICYRFALKTKEPIELAEYAAAALYFINSSIIRHQQISKRMSSFEYLLYLVEKRGFNRNKARKQLRFISDVCMSTENSNKWNSMRNKKHIVMDELLRHLRSLINKTGHSI